MIGWLRRFFSGDTVDAERLRTEQEQRIREGLHEAAARVHFLEIQAELMRHGINVARRDKEKQ
jgi:hypothetical protein